MEKITLLNPSAETWEERLGIEDSQAVIFKLPPQFPIVVAQVLLEEGHDIDELIVLASAAAESPLELVLMTMHIVQSLVAHQQDPQRIMAAAMILEDYNNGRFTLEKQIALIEQAKADHYANRKTA